MKSIEIDVMLAVLCHAEAAIAACLGKVQACIGLQLWLGCTGSRLELSIFPETNLNMRDVLGQAS